MKTSKTDDMYMMPYDVVVMYQNITYWGIQNVVMNETAIFEHKA
jgi:hypothetical protein